MRLRKGVRLKAATVYAIPSSEARGLQAISDRLKQHAHGRYSGQSSLSATEQREQASAMSVALAQPHRANVYDTRGNLIASADDKRLGTALGRFCARHRPRPLAPWLQDAGEEYADVVRRWKKAMGFSMPGGSGGGIPCPVEDENLQARREKAEMDKRKIDDALIEIAGRSGPLMMESVCFDDDDAPPHWGAKLVECLLVAADHFGMSPRNIRDKRHDGP